MSVTDNLWSRTITGSGDFPANRVAAIKALLNDWETTWNATPQLMQLYTDRAKLVRFIKFRKAKVGKMEAWSRANDQIIFIVYDTSFPDFNQIQDDTHTSLTTIGKTDATSAMASDLLFEMGNCQGGTAPRIATIRNRFFSAEISLHETGIQIAGIESRGMMGYIKLMRAIPAVDRPYKANRDVKKNEGATTERDFAVNFARTKHSAFSTTGSTSLLSGQTYALETITGAKPDDLKACVTKIGEKHLKATTVEGKKAWAEIISLIATKMNLTNAGGLSAFYQVCLGILYALQTSGVIRGLNVKDDLLEGVSPPVPIQIPFNQIKPLLQKLLSALAGPVPVVLRDDQIKARAREACIQAV